MPSTWHVVHLISVGMWLVIFTAVLAENTELPSQWVQALEASVQKPSVVDENFTLTALGFFLAGLGLMFLVAWVTSFFRKTEGVSLKSQQPHFFWIPRKK